MLSDHRAQGKPQRHWRWALNSRFLIGKPGNPMMERWRLVQTPWFGIYVHFIYREDLDPVPHDHPWRFWSLVLRGGYREEYHPDVRDIGTSRQRAHERWSLHGFPLHAAHRITSVAPRTVTLVLVGRKLRTWGFYDWRRGNAFVDWRDALGIRPTEGSRSTGKYPKLAALDGEQPKVAGERTCLNCGHGSGQHAESVPSCACGCTDFSGAALDGAE